MLVVALCSLLICQTFAARVTEEVYFDFQINGQDAGRVKIGLFGDIVPKTVRNFVQLATKGTTFDGHSGRYQGSFIHRVIDNFMIQGGDFERGDGTGGFSMYGHAFDDENFRLKHTGPGMVAMANTGPQSNGSQFYITTVRAPWLDNTHVVFGKVTSGMDTVRLISRIQRDEADRPLAQVKIVRSGVTNQRAFEMDIADPFLDNFTFYLKFVVLPTVVTLVLAFFLRRVLLKFEQVEKACDELEEKREYVRRKSLELGEGNGIDLGKMMKPDQKRVTKPEPKKEK